MLGNTDQLSGVTVFVKVVEAGGFSAAAKALGHSTSYVSKAVTRLEERLGTRLLNRTTRTISLTDDGRQYFDRCRAIVDAADEAEASLTRDRETPSGVLRMSAPVSFGLSHLRHALPQFLDAHPKIDLHVEFNDRFVDVVAEGFDLVIRVGDMKDTSLIARRLMRARSVVVAAPSYWDQHGRPDHPSDLSRHSCIGYGFKQTPDHWEFAGADGRPVNVTVPLRAVCNSAEMEIALAAGGVGVTRLPLFICADEVESGGLEIVLQPFEIDPISIQAVYPHRAHLSAKVRAMVDFLVDCFGDDA